MMSTSQTLKLKSKFLPLTTNGQSTFSIFQQLRHLPRPTTGQHSVSTVKKDLQELDPSISCQQVHLTSASATPVTSSNSKAAIDLIINNLSYNLLLQLS